MKPQLITAERLAAEAAQAWHRAYDRFPADPSWPFVSVAAALDALGECPTPDSVNAAIGNKSWTSPPSCDGCGADADRIVRVGQEPDYDSHTAHLCEACLREALTLLTETTP